MHLSVEAHASKAFSIHSTGRSADLCSSLDQNLILDTYRSTLAEHHRIAAPLRLAIHNEIPLGMGCGSSAAALLAGVVLANHFGVLHWDDAAIVAEASRREGHPDNVAACWHGGFTVSTQTTDGQTTTVETATFPGDPAWELILAIPPTSLATTAARALLPDTYTRADAVFNIQRSALLTAAFAQARLDLLRTATQDRLHQPYRAAACPLLADLLPLAVEPEIAAVTLSGAGPSVLLFLTPGITFLEAETRLRQLVAPEVEILSLRIAEGVSRTIL